MIMVKTNNEIKIMREANRIIAIVLNEINDLIKPGVSTYELDKWAEEKILSLNAKPGFKGYGPKSNPYPATLCTSINEEVVHGIPSKDRILEEGDIIGIDVGSIYKGYYGDGAYTFAVGEISDEVKDLLYTCKESLYKGIEKAVVGNRVNDISKAIDRYVRPKGYEIVRSLSGHGIGKNLHEDPVIVNYDNGRKGHKIKRNMTFAIEPMITNGTWEVKTLPDGWTVVTADGSYSAHYEHTVVITDNGPEILTRI